MLGIQDRQYVYFFVMKTTYYFLTRGSGLERCQPDWVTSQVQWHGGEENQMASRGPAETRGINLSWAIRSHPRTLKIDPVRFLGWLPWGRASPELCPEVTSESCVSDITGNGSRARNHFKITHLGSWELSYQEKTLRVCSIIRLPNSP